jgi:hypothetical protein
MASSKQQQAARRNIKNAAKAAKKKRTIAHLPKQTRTALGRSGQSGKEETLGLPIGVAEAAELFMSADDKRSIRLAVTHSAVWD